MLHPPAGVCYEEVSSLQWEILPLMVEYSSRRSAGASERWASHLSRVLRAASMLSWRAAGRNRIKRYNAIEIGYVRLLPLDFFFISSLVFVK